MLDTFGCGCYFLFVTLDIGFDSLGKILIDDNDTIQLFQAMLNRMLIIICEGEV